MNTDFESSAKFGEAFKSLQCLDLTIEELDLSVRNYNFLKRENIHHLEQLLAMSMDDLINICARRAYSEIVERLQHFNEQMESNKKL